MSKTKHAFRIQILSFAVEKKFIFVLMVVGRNGPYLPKHILQN